MQNYSSDYSGKINTQFTVYKECTNCTILQFLRSGYTLKECGVAIVTPIKKIKKSY
jgi:hypothetical protein